MVAILLVAFALLLEIALICKLFKLSVFRQKPVGIPNGNIFHLPLSGEISSFLKSHKSSSGTFFHQRLSRYGSVFKSHLFSRPTKCKIKGPFWKVPLGRRDGNVSIANEVFTNLPPPFFNITQLIASFAAKGLSVKDLVVLSGGHTIGVSHCSSFTNRLYNFTGRNDVDPNMDPNYVAALRRRCSPTDTTSIVQMDPRSSKDFNEDYYTLVRKRRGLFTTDAELLKNSETRAYVQQHSTSSHDSCFFKDFAESMVKMGKVGVLTGTAGQIRRICSVVN